MGKATGRAEPGDQLRALRATRDPRQRVALATALLEDLRVMGMQASELRDAAIVRLHELGSSYQDIATAAGLTRGRVAQVVQRTYSRKPPVDSSRHKPART